jgi:hypothetical protein
MPAQYASLTIPRVNVAPLLIFILLRFGMRNVDILYLLFNQQNIYLLRKFITRKYFATLAQ